MDAEAERRLELERLPVDSDVGLARPGADLELVGG